VTEPVTLNDETPERLMALIAELTEENDRFRHALELIAEGSTDKLKALQAKSALTNIGPKISHS